MKRVIFNNIDDFHEFLGICLDDKHYLGYTLGSMEEVESLFGIKFCNEEMIPFDEIEDEECDDNGTFSHIRYIADEDSNIPTEYPALCCFEISNDFDRMGDCVYRVVNYVYPSMFRSSRTVKEMTEDYCCFGYDPEPFEVT